MPIGLREFRASVSLRPTIEGIEILDPINSYQAPPSTRAKVSESAINRLRTTRFEVRRLISAVVSLFFASVTVGSKAGV